MFQMDINLICHIINIDKGTFKVTIDKYGAFAKPSTKSLCFLSFQAVM